MKRRVRELRTRVRIGAAFAAVLWWAGPSPAPTPAMAASGGKSAGTILTMGTGARAAALGEAYGALGDDVFAALYNPGGLAGVRQTQVAAQHAVWFRGSAVEYLGFAHPLSAKHTLGVSALLMSSGDLERTFERPTDGDYDLVRSQGAFATGQMVVAASYAFRLGALRTGLTAKLVRDDVDGQVAQAVATDAGLQYDPVPGLRAGLSVLNLGGRLGSDPLPTQVRGGISLGGHGRIRLPVDILVPLDSQRARLGGGVEVTVFNGLTLRGGIRTGQPVVPSGGAGWRWRGFCVDYAFGWFSAGLGDVHRVSLSYGFGPERAEAAR